MATNPWAVVSVTPAGGAPPQQQAPASQGAAAPSDPWAVTGVTPQSQPAQQGQSLLDRAKDYLANGPSGTDANGQTVHGIDPQGNALTDLAAGAGKTVVSGVAGLAQLAHDGLEHVHKGLGEYGASQASIDAAKQYAAPSNANQVAGEGLGEVYEFMTGIGAAKDLSYIAKMKDALPILQKLEKASPLVRRIVGSSVRNAAVGAVQGTVNSGSVREGVKEGAVAGGTAGVLEPVAAGGGKLLDKAGQILKDIKPDTINIAGVKVPRLASQRPIANTTAEPAIQPSATPQNTPSYAKAQQEASKQVTANLAQGALKDSLDRLNLTRRTIDPSRMLPASSSPEAYFDVPTGSAPEPVGEERMAFDPRKRQIGTQLVAKPEGTYNANSPGQALRKEPQFQYLTGIKPGTEPVESTVAGPGTLKTNDPAAAEGALYRLNAMAEDGTLPANMREAHSTLADQVKMYHAQQAGESHFHVIDTDAATDGVSNFGEAADRLSNIHQPTWDKLDQVSDGQFGALRRTEKQQLQVIQNGTDSDVIDRAYDKLDGVRQDMSRLFDEHAGEINPREWTAAKQGYADQMVLDKTHAAFEGATNGVSEAEEARSTARGGSLKRNIQGMSTMRIEKLLQREPRAAQLLGRSGVDNAKEMAALLEKPQQRQDASKLSSMLAAHGLAAGARITGLGLIGGEANKLRGGSFLEGAGVGASVGLGSGKAMSRLMTNPEAGRLFRFAVENRVSPRVAVPLIAGSLSNGYRRQGQTQTQPQTGTGTGKGATQ